MLSRHFIFCVFIAIAANADGQFTVRQADRLLQELNENSIQNYDSTNRLCKKLLNIYQKNKNLCKQVQVMTFISLCESNNCKFKEALETINSADKIFLASKCDEQLILSIYYSYVTLYINLNDFRKSDSLARVGIALWQPLWSDKSTLIKLYLALGNGDKKLEYALPSLEKAYELSRLYNKTELELSSLISLGTSYANNGKFSEALKYFKKALPVAEKRKDNRKLGFLYNNLAGLLNEPSKQRIYIDSALYFANLTGNLSDIETYTENNAYFHYNIGEFKQGYDELWEAMTLKDSLLNIKKYEAVADMEQKYEAEKKSNVIQKLTLEKLATEVNSLRYRRNQYRLLAGSLALLFIAIFLAYRFFTIRKNRNELAKKNIEVNLAKRASDDLLMNILPEDIANELKIKGSSKSRVFEQVSIIFTDFINFTGISQNLSASELVDELNYCFSGFDDILEKYKIEKIKTIGDAYLAVGNLPLPIDKFAKNSVLAALEMQQFIENRKFYLDAEGKPSFEMRLGINVGTVVAGIVGLKKFQYDIWGDAVNTAQRMENKGEANKVNISESTYEMVKDEPEFTFEYRGKIEVKGKGEIDMYFVSFKY